MAAACGQIETTPQVTDLRLPGYPCCIFREAFSMKHFCVCLLLCALCPALLAQKKNPVTTVIKEILPRQAKNLQAAVETMPADKFSFKPTPPQMTFGHLVTHIIDSNYYLCA